MALLSAEDVLNKAFQKTKYREGFDQDEVDDFLDEVANTIAVLTAERDELAQRLASLSGGDPTVAAVAVPAVASRATTQPRQPVASDSGEAPSATSMLAMAQKLHDDYVQAGEAERERLIQEGKAKAEALVGQAESDARARLNSLDAEATELERRVEELRRFERDYRTHLRGYLEGLLGDLESPAGGAPAAASPIAPAPAPSTTPFDTAGTYADATQGFSGRRAAQAAGGFDPSAPSDAPRWD